MIKYLKHHQIDFQLWDRALSDSPDGLVYAMAWYLNIVSPGWEALVEEDYQYIMPLPVRRKYGIAYLSQPPFTQQLGIFSQNLVTPEIVEKFIRALPRKFLKIHISLNQLNMNCHNFVFQKGINYILPLNNTYDQISAGYHGNTRRNIRKSYLQELKLATLDKDIFIEKCRLQKSAVPESVFCIMDQLLEEALKRNVCEIYAVYNRNNEILAATAFIKALNRLFYLVSYSFAEGKEFSAMFMMVDSVIRKYAGSSMVLDFEGSVIPGIARFFAGFGAFKTEFPVYKRLF